MVSLKFDTDNAAFSGEIQGRAEISRILKEVAEEIRTGMVSNSIRDINGNFIGRYQIEIS